MNELTTAGMMCLGCDKLVQVGEVTLSTNPWDGSVWHYKPACLAAAVTSARLHAELDGLIEDVGKGTTLLGYTKQELEDDARSREASYFEPGGEA